jgi:UDP-GlcNAc:undecaprenyl-phosphate GlcNAc-1-phosphate transferase
MALILNSLFSRMTLSLLPVLVFLVLPQVKHFAGLHHSTHAVYLILLSFIISFILMPIVIAIGHVLNIVDKPDAVRKDHKHPTPLTGGLAIYAAFALTIVFNFDFSMSMKGILVAGTLIFATGIIDDWTDLPAWFRLLVQIIAAGILIACGVRITFIPDWLGGFYVETILTVLWLVGITNSMNFIDGMDGLASGTSIIYAFFFGIIAWTTNQYYMMYLSITIAGSCAGFFPYNFQHDKPAAVFLGDSGATFLGFMMASFAILGEWGKDMLDIAIPVLIMSVLIFDMSLTTLVRIRTGEVKSFGEWLRYTGRDHFHHRLTALGLNQKQAALIFFTVSICFGIESVTMLFANFANSVLVLIHTALVFILLGYILVRRNNIDKK